MAEPGSRFELVIFDCDGVLVDSELITNRVFAAMLNELGLPVTLEEMFERFVGRSLTQCLEIIEGLLHGPVPPGFVAAYHERTTAALRLELRPVPGIETVLASIGIPYCVASSGNHEKMRITLDITGLLPLLDGRIFSVADVARSKPFPDVFLYAARQSGVAPGACAVVEDTPTGVIAGVAAGMTVFGYSALTPAKVLSAAGAHQVFARMNELTGLLTAPRVGREALLRSVLAALP